MINDLEEEQWRDMPFLSLLKRGRNRVIVETIRVSGILSFNICCRFRNFNGLNAWWQLQLPFSPLKWSLSSKVTVTCRGFQPKEEVHDWFDSHIYFSFSLFSFRHWFRRHHIHYNNFFVTLVLFISHAQFGSRRWKWQAKETATLEHEPRLVRQD